MLASEMSPNSSTSKLHKYEPAPQKSKTSRNTALHNPKEIKSAKPTMTSNDSNSVKHGVLKNTSFKPSQVKISLIPTFNKN